MKYNKLYRWFLTLMMSLPIISIVVRCIYVQKNQNAYLSYSGENTSDVTYESKNVSQLSLGDKVYYTNTNQELIQRTGTDLYITATDIKVNNVIYTTADTIQFYAYPSSPNSTALYMVIKNGNETLYNRNVLENQYEVYFTFTDYNANAASSVYLDINFNKIIYNNNSYLDSAFEYSVNEFNNVGFNKINFTQWFTNLFTNGDNIYTTFINSYCNYVLFSTCVLALPYFLYWFITFVMGLMDRFGRKEIMR